MRRVRLAFLALFLPVIGLAAQESSREGWAANVLPAAGYDSDYGFMIGGFLDLNDYGGLYPNYRHRFCAEVLVFSQHASYYMLQYDSKYLIPGLRTQAKIYFDNDPLHGFYGFNGDAQKFHSDYHLNKETGIAYYSFDRKYLNAMLELGGDFSEHFSWTARAAYWKYWLHELDWKDYSSTNTLYRAYRENGLIEGAESGGGSVLEFKAGLKFDTRDMEAAPTRGIYADVNLDAAPDVFQTGYDYLKLSARMRQYMSLGTERLVLAYSLAWQGTIAGNPAFYSQPYIIHFKPTDGLGGATTLRGVMLSRLIGNDYAWGNIELRARMLDFGLWGRRVFVVANPFFDAGMITRPFRLDRQVNMQGTDRESLMADACKMHMTWGIGGQLVIDYNFIPSLVVGFPLDKNDGDIGIYMTLDYTF